MICHLDDIIFKLITVNIIALFIELQMIRKFLIVSLTVLERTWLSKMRREMIGKRYI